MWWFATCDVMWCDVISCCPVLLSTTKYYSVLQSTTPVLLYYKVLLQYYKVLRQYYSVLQSTTPYNKVLLRTTKYYASTTLYYSSTTKYYPSTTPYYKVLCQHNSVLQSTGKYYSSTTKYYASTTKYYASTTQHYEVLLRTTKYYASTTPVLLWTTPVLQSTSRVLLRTTKYYASTTPYYSSTTKYYSSTTRYYASTTLYYKVLIQYYKVLQSITPSLRSTTPVLLCTTKYYSVLQSTTPVLLCTTKYYSSTTKYYSVLQSTNPVLQSTTPVLQSTTPVLQSTTPSSEPATKSDTWASPNIAPVKQNDSHAWSWSHMKRHLQCAEQQVSPSNLTKYCACHTEWLACLIVVTYETSFTMRGATGVTIQPHQILRLPHRMTRMLDRRHIWNVIYNARSNRCHHPTSPNTAPATQNDSHAWSSSHMKRHLQCAEQQVSPSNLTKYCACHEKWLDCFIVLTYETSFPMRGATGVTIQPHQILRLPRKMTRLLYRPHIWNVISNARSNRCHDPTSPNTAPATKNDTARFQRKSPKTDETSFPMRGRSEHDPSMIRPWKRKPQPASQPRLLFEVPRSIFYCKIQRFAPNLTFKPSPNTAPATKSATWTSPNTAPATKSATWTSPNTAPATKSDTWTSPSTAPATKSDTWTSPSTAPATKSDTWTSPSTAPATKNDIINFSKYCTCHE